MPFDPTWPPQNAEVESAPFRNQFNALNDMIIAQAALITTMQGQIADLQTQLAAKATAIPNVALFDTNIPYHTPMEPGDFDPIYAKVNEVITSLQS